MELPANLSVHKPKKPKGLSWPLQTSEIVAGLNLGEIKHPFSLGYDNQKPDFTKPSNQKSDRYWNFDFFPVLSITWYGHIAASKVKREKPYFFMSVDVVKSAYRQELNKILTEDVLPVLNKWLRGTDKLPYINQVRLGHGFLKDDGCGARGWKVRSGLELVENGERVLWSMPLELGKKDERPEGTVLGKN